MATSGLPAFRPSGLPIFRSHSIGGLGVFIFFLQQISFSLNGNLWPSGLPALRSSGHPVSFDWRVECFDSSFVSSKNWYWTELCKTLERWNYPEIGLDSFFLMATSDLPVFRPSGPPAFRSSGLPVSFDRRVGCFDSSSFSSKKLILNWTL